MSLFLKILIIILSPFLLASCDMFHSNDYYYCEEPDEPVSKDLPVVINFNFDTELPLYKEITFTRNSDSPNYDLRYILLIYEGGVSANKVPSYSYTYTRPFETDHDYTVTIELPDGDYEFLAFTDNIIAGSSTDKFYNTSSLEMIKILDGDGHPGAEEMRDCFRGTVAKSVRNSPDRYDGNTIDIPMLRPLSRFEFIATDFDRFVESEVNRSRNLTGSKASSGINAGEYKVLIQYDGFMPSTYDAFNDYPTDAKRNVTFNASVIPNDDGTASMGFDYVFVYQGESKLNLILNVLDADGKLISATPSIEVPLYRSKNTVIKGEFLTSKSSGGVGIVPDYDGEYNVEFH